ncbi:MAG: hypothetical protein MUO76_01505 [Anaerolineaceae bacterium]|nr:hypothetical protein [Anaerolineaceae bacterium]
MSNQKISKKPGYDLHLANQETGVKADTFRAWERRYHLPRPKCTDGGLRLSFEYEIRTTKKDSLITSHKKKVLYNASDN